MRTDSKRVTAASHLLSEQLLIGENDEDGWDIAHDAVIRELELIEIAEQAFERHPVEAVADRAKRAGHMYQLLRSASSELVDLLEERDNAAEQDREQVLRQVGWLLWRAGRGDLWRAYFWASTELGEVQLGDELRFLLDDL